MTSGRSPHSAALVGGRVSEGSRRKSCPTVAGIVHEVEHLQESVAVGEVQARAGVFAIASDDEVDAVCSSTDGGIEL